MTASNNDDSGSDNSDPGARNGAPPPDETTPRLRALIEHVGGWIVLEAFIADLGLERDDVFDAAQRLAAEPSNGFGIVNLGKKTILVGPGTDPHDAIAALFDRYESTRHPDPRHGPEGRRR